MTGYFRAMRSAGVARALRSSDGKLTPWLLLILAAGYVGVWWVEPIGSHIWSPLGDDMMHGDSTSFLFSDGSSKYRWIGYPMFLEAVDAVFGSVRAAPRPQLVLLAAAVWFMCVCIWRALRVPWLALALAVVVFGQCAVARFHAYLLSEALFIPLLCAMMGALAMLVRRPTAPWAATAALFCGLAIATRPAALPMLAVWPILAWFLWPRCAGRRVRLAASVAAPLAVVFLGEAMIWREVHDGLDERPSIVDQILFGKALVMEADPTLREPPLWDDQLADFVAGARRSTAPLRDLVADAPEWRMRAVILRNAEAVAESTYRTRLRSRLAELAEHRGASVYRLLGDVARPAVLSAPREWLANAVTHWLAMWTYYSINDAAFTRRYSDYVGGRADAGDDSLLRSALIAHPPAVAPEPLAVVYLGRLAGIAALLSSLVAAVAIWQRASGRALAPDDALVVAAVAALVVHGYVLLAAVVQKPHLRYFIAMWPLQALYGLLLIQWALSRLRRRRA